MRHSIQTPLEKRSGYLYLLLNPNLPKGVLKIGRTKNLDRRLAEYPRGCKYIDTFGICVDVFSAETSLKHEFVSKFDIYKGNEYFRGNTDEMRSIFTNFCTEDPTPMIM
ncbi:T5orf172 domain-containing protein [Tetraselmis virus 1]|uniref:T5orf172 domain-containing protein n=1 Tax=Tetraselmis virus 1 TaxID=2060617 RepID=A0A2P0VNI8_9VIRU|nr:T5orf172 domain-containing protein [Tetraselmis virus 1]AUF82465.1 T5orf172 domain-containing protein [Tetraselmis virus 1]